MIAAGGPALLFTRVRGAAFPLVTNLFGTARRARAGVRPAARHVSCGGWSQLAETLLPPTPAKLWGARDVAREALRIGLRAGARARSPRSSRATCASTGCPR